ncbi:hypothetical protein EQG49_06635 [Periweissella cryptocerci]|uniref:Uncharacterized protein n=1 Tax=Periweissella cryptocerci TaxID=2506420 RepID=A0A4P6YTR8_9LACO|nr:hypothetical protein [Periweissella cryptocerci]QBO36158.1 hypothetical protein EQG49_06635 [Periweissella cryptocerci]
MKLKFSRIKESNVSSSAINDENNQITVQRGYILAIKLVSTVYAAELKPAHAKQANTFDLL